MWWGAQPPAWLDCKGSPCSGSINNHMQEEAEREQLYPNLLDPHRIKNLVVRPQPSLQRIHHLPFFFLQPMPTAPHAILHARPCRPCVTTAGRQDRVYRFWTFRCPLPGRRH